MMNFFYYYFIGWNAVKKGNGISREIYGEGRATTMVGLIPVKAYLEIQNQE